MFSESVTVELLLFTCHIVCHVTHTVCHVTHTVCHVAHAVMSCCTHCNVMLHTLYVMLHTLYVMLHILYVMLQYYLHSQPTQQSSNEQQADTSSIWSLFTMTYYQKLFDVTTSQVSLFILLPY